MPDKPKPMLRITVEDLDEGTTETVEMPKGEYFIVTASPCYVAHQQIYGGGKTVQVTIKDRLPPEEGAMSQD